MSPPPACRMANSAKTNSAKTNSAKTNSAKTNSAYDFLKVKPIHQQLGEEAITYFTKIDEEHHLNLASTITKLREGFASKDALKALDPMLRCIIRIKEIIIVARHVERCNMDEIYTKNKNGDVKVKAVPSRVWSTALIPNDEATGYLRARIEMCGWERSDDQDLEFDRLVENGDFDPVALFATGQRVKSRKVLDAKAAIAAKAANPHAAVETGKKRKAAEMEDVEDREHSDDETICDDDDNMDGDDVQAALEQGLREIREKHRRLEQEAAAKAAAKAAAA